MLTTPEVPWATCSNCEQTSRIWIADTKCKKISCVHCESQNQCMLIKILDLANDNETTCLITRESDLLKKHLWPIARPNLGGVFGVPVLKFSLGARSCSTIFAVKNVQQRSFVVYVVVLQRLPPGLRLLCRDVVLQMICQLQGTFWLSRCGSSCRHIFWTAFLATRFSSLLQQARVGRYDHKRAVVVVVEESPAPAKIESYLKAQQYRCDGLGMLSWQPTSCRAKCKHTLVVGQSIELSVVFQRYLVWFDKQKLPRTEECRVEWCRIFRPNWTDGRCVWMTFGQATFMW